MFRIQFFDYEEGSAARWNDVANSTYDTREQAREALLRIKRADREYYEQFYEDCLVTYRIVEVGSHQYYSQPTDKGEY